MLEDIVNEYRDGAISFRQLLYRSKNEFYDEAVNLTRFIETDDLSERLFYIVNDLNEIVKCPYCGNKAKWTGRFKDGYKTTCCSKECESKRISESKKGVSISKNRDNDFYEWQRNARHVDDNVIKDHIKYEKFIDLVDNDIILNYLKNRYEDSSSIQESYKRIFLGIDKKPLCPTCGKPVVFLGRKDKMFSTYCSDKCTQRNKSTIEKKKQTQLKNWGSENCYDSEKYKALVKEKYGVEYVFQRDDVKEKRKSSLIEHYGTTKLFSISEIREKIKKTNLIKFGYDSIFKSPEYRNKMYEKCKENGKLKSSKQEDQIYSFFLEIGITPERLYKSEKFPYVADFYLAEHDLYVEYQGSQFHNNRAFLNSKEDLLELRELENRDKERKEITRKTTQYQNIIKTWTYFDVNKRNYAFENNVNYLEIYDCKKVEDLFFQLNFYLSCKNNDNLFVFNNDDLAEEYNHYKNCFSRELEGSSRKNLIIKHFQGNNFYKAEMDIFANDPIKRRKLIQNRCKFLNKKENQLTVEDLISGFKKSGIHYGYSHFNPLWTNWFINKFNIKSVYDPCGGWGHHMLGMLQCEKIIYNDLSKPTYEGVCKIKEYFNIDHLECHNEDGRTFIPDDVDGFFMCPPYYNIEHYDCGDFIDIEDYKNFLNDIFKIWRNSKAKVFGLILRDDFVELIEDKYSEKHEMKVITSHLAKSKKHKEFFYIYKKYPSKS